ncbi:hypothetical protein XM57_08655 [Burkholderia cepacia]|nr:hypothetical protein XM57_08655 [Burkholderia cepacia]
MHARAAGGFTAGPDHGIIRGLHAGRKTAAGLLRTARPPGPRVGHDPCAARAAPAAAPSVGRLYLKYGLV